MTDFQPGDSVQHPEKGRGYVISYGLNWPGRIRIIYIDPKASCGYNIDIFNLDGWKRIEGTPPADAYDTAADYLDAVNDNREHDPAIRDLRSQAQCLREDAARAHLRRP